MRLHNYKMSFSARWDETTGARPRNHNSTTRHHRTAHTPAHHRSQPSPRRRNFWDAAVPWDDLHVSRASRALSRYPSQSTWSTSDGLPSQARASLHPNKGPWTVSCSPHRCSRRSKKLDFPRRWGMTNPIPERLQTTRHSSFCPKPQAIAHHQPQHHPLDRHESDSNSLGHWLPCSRRSVQSSPRGSNSSTSRSTDRYFEWVAPFQVPAFVGDHVNQNMQILESRTKGC